MNPTVRARLLTIAVAALCLPAWAGGALRQAPPEGLSAARTRVEMLPPPEGMRVLDDIAYGSHPKQRYDVYLPAAARSGRSRLPVILMLHGGGWRRGDKTSRGVAGNKLAYWLPKGYAVVSVNTRLVPDASALEQARDAASALAHAQSRAQSWGADPEAFVLMGHSAGAHVVALLGASPTLVAQAGARAPMGVVALDSAALDVVDIMTSPWRPRLYDAAFGGDRDGWIAASPWHRLARGAPPMLVVCSTRRAVACAQARRFAERGAGSGVRVELMPQPLSHMEINQALGLPSAYSDAVAAFLDGLRR